MVGCTSESQVPPDCRRPALPRKGDVTVCPGTAVSCAACSAGPHAEAARESFAASIMITCSCSQVPCMCSTMQVLLMSLRSWPAHASRAVARAGRLGLTHTGHGTGRQVHDSKLHWPSSKSAEVSTTRRDMLSLNVMHYAYGTGHIAVATTPPCIPTLSPLCQQWHAIAGTRQQCCLSRPVWQAKQRKKRKQEASART